MVSNSTIKYEFKKLNMVWTGCVNEEGQILGRYRKFGNEYLTEVKVKNNYYFTGTYPSIKKSKKAILKRIANGN